MRFDEDMNFGAICWTHSIKTWVIGLVLILLSALVIGCDRKETSVPPPVLPPVRTPADMPTTLPVSSPSPTGVGGGATSVAEMTPTTTPTLESTQAPTEPPPSPTATPCGPPSGWVVYVVQPGDNLFRLSLRTQTTVEQVKLANCLDNETIYVGQQLHLPFIPIPPTSPPPPTPVPTVPQEPECATSFCPDPALAGSLTIDPGGPNQFNFVPCESVIEPRIEFDTTTKIVELGQRRYFYVCVENAVSVSITREDGSAIPVTLLDALPNPDLKMGNAQAVVDWPVLPPEPTGVHTMTVTRSDGPPVPFRFLVAAPGNKHILVVPAAGPPGTVFQVYYVNFDLGATLDFDFYGEDVPVAGGMHEMSLRDQWQVMITRTLDDGGAKGWAYEPLVSEMGNAVGAYAVSFNNKEVYDLFWLR